MDIIKKSITVILSIFLFSPAYAQAYNGGDEYVVHSQHEYHKYNTHQRAPTEQEKKEYIESLKKQGLSDKEIQKKLRAFEG